MSERGNEAIALMAHMKEVSSLYGQFRISTRGKLWNRLAHLIARCEARADLAAERERQSLELMSLIVDRKWSIASPVQARPDDYDAATHLMCSIEKQVIDRARAILNTHESQNAKGEDHE